MLLLFLWNNLRLLTGAVERSCSQLVVDVCVCTNTCHEESKGVSRCNSDLYPDEKKGGKCWTWGGDNVMGGWVERRGEGGQHIERERDREGRENTQRTEDQQHCGGVCSELEHAVAQWRRLPKIERFLLLPFSSSAVRDNGFTEETSLLGTGLWETEGARQRWTEKGLCEGGSPLWGGPGDGVRATFLGR